MTFAELTPASLNVALEALASSKNEQDCAQSLVSAATLFQSAVLANQAPAEVKAAIAQIPAHLLASYQAVLNRCVNFHFMEDGSMLGLWLLPVIITAKTSLSSIIKMETKSINNLKLGSLLQKQLGLTTSATGLGRPGWTHIVPSLFAYEQLKTVDVAELIRLPHAASALAKSAKHDVVFKTGNAHDVEAGTNLYFLPFVAYMPAGALETEPQASVETIERMSAWVEATLGDEVTVEVAPTPQPYSFALGDGKRLRAMVQIKTDVAELCNEDNIQPNALAALVAPYDVGGNGEFVAVVGVTLVSRLDGQVVRTFAINALSRNAVEDVALVKFALQDLGMDCIEAHSAVHVTGTCQHCGNMQYDMPNPELFLKGIAPVEPHQVH